MSVSYDVFCAAFLEKISEYELLKLDESTRTDIVDGYMKRAVTAFKKICEYDLTTTSDDTLRVFNTDIADEDIDEIVDIISEGMVVQWMKPYVNQQDLLMNVLTTRDFNLYSPAELLMRIGNAYNSTKSNFTQMMREYSYNHGDLSDLHL